MATLALFFAGSCFGHRRANPWPTAAQSNDCSATRGTYSNAGESTDPADTTKLTKFFFGDPVLPKSPDPRASATRVTLDLVSATVLEVSAWDGETRLDSMRIPGCSCRDGKLAFRTFTQAKGPDAYFTIFAIGQAKWRLLPAADGSLIVESESGGFGLELFIPVAGGGTDYWRYQRVSAPTNVTDAAPGEPSLTPPAEEGRR